MNNKALINGVLSLNLLQGSRKAIAGLSLFTFIGEQRPLVAQLKDNTWGFV